MAKKTHTNQAVRPRAGEPSIDQIRRAITAHCGGWDNATDAQLLRAWRELPHETQTQYLAGLDGPAKETAEPSKQNAKDSSA